MLSLFGLLLGLALLIWLTMRGVELLIAAPLCALLVAITSGFAPFPQLAAEGAPTTGTRPSCISAAKPINPCRAFSMASSRACALSVIDLTSRSL